MAQDDQCKPELATNAATKLISDKVVAIMGPICSGATNASLPMYESANIISISPTATTPALTLEGKHPLFQMCIRDRPVSESRSEGND